MFSPTTVQHHSRSEFVHNKDIRKLPRAQNSTEFLQKFNELFQGHVHSIFRLRRLLEWVLVFHAESFLQTFTVFDLKWCLQESLVFYSKRSLQTFFVLAFQGLSETLLVIFCLTLSNSLGIFFLRTVYTLLGSSFSKTVADFLGTFFSKSVSTILRIFFNDFFNRCWCFFQWLFRAFFVVFFLQWLFQLSLVLSFQWLFQLFLVRFQWHFQPFLVHFFQGLAYFPNISIQKAPWWSTQHTAVTLMLLDCILHSCIQTISIASFQLKLSDKRSYTSFRKNAGEP